MLIKMLIKLRLIQLFNSDWSNSDWFRRRYERDGAEGERYVQVM